jgi:hypothetical protein
MFQKEKQVSDSSGPAVPHEETVQLGNCKSISEDYTLQGVVKR